MATLTSKLERARTRVESLLLNTDAPLASCAITEDLAGTNADTFNRSTGMWVDAVTPEALYAGPCTITIDNVTEVEQGGQGTAVVRATANVPLAQTDVVEGCSLIVTDCDRDPNLIGRVFRVDAVHAGAMAMMRKLSLVEYRGDTLVQSDA